MTNAETCESIPDPRNNWNRTIDENILIRLPQLTKYTQNCSLWSIDFRKNKTDCPALIRPDCSIMNAPNANFGCPFGTTNGNGGNTNEFCECVGLIKETMKINHSFNCTCTRNLNKKKQKIKNQQECHSSFLFQKKCVIHRPYVVWRRNASTKQRYNATRYNINCTFVKCYDKQNKELIHLTGLNGTCSNETTTTTTTTKIFSSSTRPTTTKTTTTIGPTSTTSQLTTCVPTTKTKNISRTKITSLPTTKTTYVTRSHANISTTVFKNLLTSAEKSFTLQRNFNSIPSDLNVSKEDLIDTLIIPSTQLTVPDAKLEYSTQTNQGSIVSIMLFMASLQLFIGFAFGFLARTRRGQDLERKLRERTRKE